MKYLPALVLFIGLATWMIVAGRKPSGDEDTFKILTAEQFDAALSKVRDLTQDPILTFDEGKKLTSSQLDDLREGTEKIKQLIAFEPTNFGPYVMMAKSQRALGRAEEAVRNYKQALLLLPKEIKDQETLWTAAEVNYDLGTHYYELGDFRKAEEYALEAVLLINTHPKYLVGLAAIQAQLGKLKDSRALLDSAMQIDPDNEFSKSLDAELKKAGY
jgi:tetratricopeptide (TPR) repeat protein